MWNANPKRLDVSHVPRLMLAPLCREAIPNPALPNAKKKKNKISDGEKAKKFRIHKNLSYSYLPSETSVIADYTPISFGYFFLSLQTE